MWLVAMFYEQPVYGDLRVGENLWPKLTML